MPDSDSYHANPEDWELYLYSIQSIFEESKPISEKNKPSDAKNLLKSIWASEDTDVNYRGN